MNSLKKTYLKEEERREFEKTKWKKDLETFSLFPIAIVIYIIAITILYKKKKITWSDTGSLVLEKWAYMSLGAVTILITLTFTAILIGAIKLWRGLFFKSVDETELLVKEIEKTNPEILERLEKEVKEK